jgi:O-antigen ligase
MILILASRASLDRVLGLLSFPLGGSSISLGALLNVALLSVALFIVWKKKFQLPIQIVVAWCPLLLIALFMTLRSPETIDAFRAYLVLCSYAAVFIISFHLNLSTKHELLIIQTLLVSAFLPAFFAIFEFLVINGASFDSRVKSVFPHSNIFAFYCVVLIGYFAHYVNKENNLSKPSKRLVIIAIFSILICLILTQTRSAWAGLYIFGVIYTALARPRYLLYVLCAPMLFLLVEPVRNRLIDAMNYSGHDISYLFDVAQGLVPGSEKFALTSYEWRKVLWQASLQKFADHPIFGHGFNSFKYYSAQFFPLGKEGGAGAHSVYIQYMFEIGVLGIIAFIWVFLSISITSLSAFKNQRKDVSFVISMLTLYIIISYSDNIVDYLSFNWYFWFLIGMYFSKFAINSSTVYKNSNINQFHGSYSNIKFDQKFN